jgi:oligopeptide transport system ATP-binding protein
MTAPAPPKPLLPKGDSVQGLRVRPLVRVENLAKFFPVRQGFFSRLTFLRAVDGVTLHLLRGETLGLVGESGCGKSTLGRSILRLMEPTYGRVVYDGQDIVPMKPDELRGLRRRMQIIFQDPYSSLNPKMTVRDTVGEALRIHGLVRGAAEEEREVASLLDKVGLRADSMKRYPHEFSGGQRQRIGIARALAVRPEFIVCDEPISALDVSIQAQILNLLADLQDDLGLAFLFISHDLKVVEYVSHRVAVMYLGKIVETAKTADLFDKRYHPYTRALLSAIPVAEPGRRRLRVVLEGEVPSPLDPPSGCAFHPRCPISVEKCRAPPGPELRRLAQAHDVSCWLAS